MVTLLFAVICVSETVQPGIEVEWLEPDCAYVAAGGRIGDILLTYQTQSETDAVDHPIRHMFDWFQILDQESERHPVWLKGLRRGEPLVLKLDVGHMGVSGRPRLPGPWFDTYHQAVGLIQKKQREGYEMLHGLQRTVAKAGRWDIAFWLYRTAGNYQDFHQRHQELIDDSWDFLALTGHDPELSLSQSSVLPPLALQGVVYRIGLSQSHLGRKVEAQETFDRVLELARMHPSEIGVRLLLERGNDAIYVDDYVEVDRCMKQAASMAENLCDGGALMVGILMAMARVETTRANLDTATALAAEAWDLLLTITPDPAFFASTANLQGIIAFDLNQFDLAEYFLQKAFQVGDAVSPPLVGRAGALLYLGKVERARGNFLKAEQYLESSWNIYKKEVDQQRGYGHVLTNFGWLYGDQGRWDEAEAFHREALVLHESLGISNYDISKCLASLGLTYHQLGDLERARDHYQKAVQSTGLLPDTIWYVYAHHGLGRVYRDLEDVEAAYTHFSKAVQALERIAEKVPVDPLAGSGFISDFRMVHDDLIEVCVQQGRHSRAFEILERIRGRRLRRALASQKMRDDKCLSPKLTQERRRLNAAFEALQIKRFRQQCSNEEYRLQINQLRLEQQDLQTRVQHIPRAEGDQGLPVWKRIQNKTSVIRQAPQASNPLSLDDIQSQLEPDTALLAYHLGAEALIVFALTHQQPIQAVTLPYGRSKLKHLVTDFRTTLSKAGIWEDVAKIQGQKLFSQLLAPVWPLISSKHRLVIIGDGALYQLPFSCLQRPDGFYLSQSHGVVHAASASTFTHLSSRGQNRETTGRIAVFADPDYGRVLQNPTARIVMRNLPRDLTLTPLPNTRKEALAIQSIFGQSVHLFLGDQANESNLAAMNGALGILHFACHGFTDFQNPMESGLILTLDGSKVNGENGVVRAWEIANLHRFRADLVVLSACNTGLGKISGNEGVIGLGQAFQYAGVRSVLATSWAVDDAATALFMETFYRFLHRGLDNSEALRQTRIAFLRADAEPYKAFARPYYWAAFQLFGPWK